MKRVGNLVSGIHPEIRDLVRLRDRGRCRRCGRSVVNFPASMHHRLPRGRGGKGSPCNLAVLCGSATTPGSCHEFVESMRTAAYEEGWLVLTGHDPKSIPALCCDGWTTFDDLGNAVIGGREAT